MGSNSCFGPREINPTNGSATGDERVLVSTVTGPANTGDARTRITRQTNPCQSKTLSMIDFRVVVMAAEFSISLEGNAGSQGLRFEV